MVLRAAVLLLRAASLLVPTRGSCVNRYDRGDNSCQQLFSLGFSCARDFCSADDTPDQTDGAASPTAACVYAGLCDRSCSFCATDDSPLPPLNVADCLDAVPAELRSEYPDCTAMVEAHGCDGVVRRDRHVERSRTEREYRPTSEQVSVKVAALCRQTCRSCCTDAWAVESGRQNFCSMQITTGEYSCPIHFCHSRSCTEEYPEFAGKCDATCHFCDAQMDDGMARRQAIPIPVVDNGVNRVCTSCMLDTVRRLSALRSRFAMGSNGEAEEAITLLETLVEEKAVLGTVSVVRQRFTGLDPRISLANLIVRMDSGGGDSGPANTSASIIIGGHFDCTNHRPGATADETKPAPGADDNASGIAAMLEILRVLSSMVAEGVWRPRVNILFIFFGAEEQGSIGSHRYVHNCRAANDASERLRRHRQDCRLSERFRFHASGDFRGALIIDQIGYIEPSREHGLPIIVEADGKTPGTATILRKLVRAGLRYTPEARISYSVKADRSDHLSFSIEHSAAALSRESFVNPCYHSTCDTIDRLSAPMLEAVTKMNLAAALELDWEDPESAAASRAEVVNNLELMAELELLGARRSCVCNETGLPYACGCANDEYSPPGRPEPVPKVDLQVKTRPILLVVVAVVATGLLAAACVPKRWLRRWKARYCASSHNGGRGPKYSRLSTVDDSRP